MIYDETYLRVAVHLCDTARTLAPLDLWISGSLLYLAVSSSRSCGRLDSLEEAIYEMSTTWNGNRSTTAVCGLFVMCAV